ncbi:hypothetical protein PoB_007399700 [Plakobranchus ocellatus]|uniref:Uncharacterized protein n=1 Tax=Plakobranchus ocellatus TaxID=259542 RepID=A0AAV4DT41_9GAST|nr:hypothetical protein PoB_007399700 [Plakobranchus ocellatus]
MSLELNIGSVGSNCEKNKDNYDYISTQQGDHRLSGPPSGQGASGGARTRGRKVSADLRADSLAAEPPTPQRIRLFYPTSEKQTKPSSNVAGCDKSTTL